MSSGKVKISSFPVTNSIENNDLIPIIKKTGNNAYQNYVVSGSAFTVPSSSHAIYADSVLFNNVLNKPTLISSSAQFTSSDNPTFGNVTASNLIISNTLIAEDLIVSNLVISQSQNINENLFVSGNFHVIEDAVFGSDLYVSGSISASNLIVYTSSILSGSNAIGDNQTETQSISGLVNIAGNIVLSSSYGVTADSASFLYIEPLASASIASLFSSTITTVELLSTYISSSGILTTFIASDSASINIATITTASIGKLNATSSNAVSSSYAVTASYTTGNIGSSSYATSASLSVSSSYAVSSSTSNSSISASIAVSASVAGSSNSSLSSSFATSASYALRAVSASYAAVTQIFSNSGSYVLTASNALDQNTASYANTASFANRAVSASYASNIVALGLNYVYTASNTTGNTTASYAQTASTIDRSVFLYIKSASIDTSSIANLSAANATILSLTSSLQGTASYASNAGTASYALNNSSISSSYSVSSSYSNSSSLATSSSYSTLALSSISSSVANLSNTASLAVQAVNSFTSSNAISASSYVYAQSVRRNISFTHSFTVGNILAFSGSTLTYAQANSLSGSNTYGMVETSDYVSGSLTSGSSFSVVTFGKVFLSGSSLIPGATYYLSDTIGGGYSANPPSSPTSFNQPVFLATANNEAFLYKVSPTLPYGATASYAFTSSYNLDPTIKETYNVSSASALYSVGQAIYLTQIGNIALANASSEISSRVIGIVSKVTSNTLTLAYAGRFSGSLTSCLPGDIIYLSDVIPGGYTNNKYSLLSGSVVRPVATAISDTDAILINQYATNEYIGNSLYSQTASYAAVAGALVGALPTNGNSIRDTYSASNSFIPGDVIGFDYYTHQVTRCVADNIRNSNVWGMVESANSASFTVVYAGKIFLTANYFSGSNGELFYLSPFSSGSIQSVPPTGATQVIKSVVYSISNSTGIVAINSSVPVTSSFAVSASSALVSNLAFNSLNANTAISANSAGTSVTSSYSFTASVATSAITASGLTQISSSLGFNNVSTSLNANTSSISYLNVNINGVPQKIAVYGV